MGRRDQSHRAKFCGPVAALGRRPLFTTWHWGQGAVALTPVSQNTGLPIDLPALAGDLARVETALGDSVATEDAMLTEVARSLILAGGKRLRPVLTLACAYLGGSASDDVVQGAVACELVHLGSLYHDDVMDEAPTRRGVMTANARHGNFVAIVAGDFCLAVSAQIAASLGVEVSRLLGYTIGELCKGQVRELQHLYRLDRPEASYFASIDGKTASLMAAACRVGGLTAGLDRATIEAVTTYGQRLGMVFQVADDILDVIATDEQLGKPAGNDVVEGVYTLPVLRSLDDPTHGEELRARLAARVERSGVEHVRKLVRSSRGLDEAIAVGRGFADEASDALASLSNRAVADELAGLGHALLDRLPL
jgi:heptaprenyl diphosphate synthase